MQVTNPRQREYLITPPSVILLDDPERTLQPLVNDGALSHHGPLPNYTLSSVSPQCNAPTVRRACKVRCERCGFMWDCSEL